MSEKFQQDDAAVDDGGATALAMTTAAAASSDTSDHHRSASLQDIRFADDLDEELQRFPPHHPRSVASADARRPSITSSNTAPTVSTRGLSSTSGMTTTTTTTHNCRRATSNVSSNSTASRINHPSGGGGDGEAEHQRKRKKSRSAVSEQPMTGSTSPAATSPAKLSAYTHMGIFCGLLFGLAGTVIACIALVNGGDNDAGTNDASASPLEGTGNCIIDAQGQQVCEEPTEVSFLDEVYARGYINCGLSFLQTGFLTEGPTVTTNPETGEAEPNYVGFDVDICRALAAALFDGDADAFHPHVFGLSERWTRLNSTSIDVLFRPTRTMEREVYEPSIQTGMEFSKPYFFDGLKFAGLGEFVECVETGSVNGTCADLRVCVMGPGTHVAVVAEQVPQQEEEMVLMFEDQEDYYAAFPDRCNVLAGEQPMIAEPTLRRKGYEGPYVVGEQVYSKEPLCLVTRQGDYRWTDFVDAVLESLIFAEEQGISQTRSTEMPTTQLFGPQFENMFQHAVSVNGNYGELYTRNMEAFLPRGGQNLLNDGTIGRVWAHPFGNLRTLAPDLEDASPTVKAIKERGFLSCGHILLTGLSNFDSANQRKTGFQVDLCRAISAALFDGEDQSRMITFTFPRRFPMLYQNRFDIAFNSAYTLQREVDVVDGKGVEYTDNFLYLGVQFGGIPLYVDCAERLDTFSPECQSLLVCVRGGTNLASRFAQLVRENYLVTFAQFDEMYIALREGACNVILSPSLQIQEPLVRANGYGYDGPYALSQSFFSIEQFGMTTREDDPVWSTFVEWIFQSLVYAEENGIGQANAIEMPRTNLFGVLRTEAFYHAVNIVGNFGEVYQRNLGDGEILPRGGFHLPNNGAPLLYSRLRA